VHEERSNRWDEEEEEMREENEGDESVRDEGAADREREERNRREQERQEEARREEERANREREEERARREREDREEERARKEREERENVRTSMNVYQMGEVFRMIDEKMTQAIEDIIGRYPDEVMIKVKVGMQVVMDGVRQVMSAVSDSVATERYDRRVENVEVLDRFNKVDEEVRSLNRVAEYWKETESVTKVKESEKEMEEKVKAASYSLKLLDVDFGYETEDKREIVKQVVNNMFRGDIPPVDRNAYDRIMRKTRVAILGKKTELRRDKERGRIIHTVPVL